MQRMPLCCLCNFYFCVLFFFFFNDTATTEIYTLSLHDALPIYDAAVCRDPRPPRHRPAHHRSEEHTSELQSRQYLVCRLLLEKKKKKYNIAINYYIINQKFYNNNIITY